MRKIIVGAFVSVDGVMQAPGGPDEDPSGGFTHGGWIAPLFDAECGAAIEALLSQSYDLLLGRRTYDIFAAHWPHVPKDPKDKGYDAGSAKLGEQFDRITKYVATHRPDSLAWKNSKALDGDVVAALRRLKNEDGPNLVTQGSTELVHQLFQHDLVDELRLFTFPIVLGRGKRLFDGTSAPVGLRLVTSVTSAKGTVIASYARAGAVTTGSLALEEPPREELERRKNLK